MMQANAADCPQTPPQAGLGVGRAPVLPSPELVPLASRRGPRAGIWAPHPDADRSDHPSPPDIHMADGAHNGLPAFAWLLPWP